MSKREDQAFAAWVEEFKRELETDEEVQAFELLAGTDAGRDMYRGTLREKDYYTKLNQLKTQKDELEGAQQELTEWFEKEEPIRAQIEKERDELRAKLADGSGADDPPSAVAGITPEEIAVIRAKAAKVDALDKVLPRVLGDLGAVLQDANKNGFDVDAREIMQTSVKQGIDPYRAYLLQTEDQRKAREAEAQKELEKKWFEEGRRAALSGDAPDHISPSGPSTFDILSAEDPTQDRGTVDTRQSRVNESIRQFREGEY